MDSEQGKTHTNIWKEKLFMSHKRTRDSEDCGVTLSKIHKWFKIYTVVETDNGAILTAKLVRELKKQVVLFKEENLIFFLKIALFPPTQSVTNSDWVP